MGLRFDRALLYCDLGEYQKAAESYDQIVALYPGNIVARKMAAKVNMFLCFYVFMDPLFYFLSLAGIKRMKLYFYTQSILLKLVK